VNNSPERQLIKQTFRIWGGRGDNKKGCYVVGGEF
jgi:hypothetical protein